MRGMHQNPTWHHCRKKHCLCQSTWICCHLWARLDWGFDQIKSACHLQDKREEGENPLSIKYSLLNDAKEYNNGSSNHYQKLKELLPNSRHYINNQQNESLAKNIVKLIKPMKLINQHLLNQKQNQSITDSTCWSQVTSKDHIVRHNLVGKLTSVPMKRSEIAQQIHCSKDACWIQTRKLENTTMKGNQMMLHWEGVFFATTKVSNGRLKMTQFSRKMKKL